MGNKTKAEILASDPSTLNPSDLKKYEGWMEPKKVEVTASMNGTVDAVKKTKEIAPAELIGKKTPIELAKELYPKDYEEHEDFTEAYVPEVNVESEGLELTEEIEKEILEKQKDSDLIREYNNSKTTNYTNGVNVWRLIFKSSNDILGFEKLVLAMSTGKTGVLVLVSDTKDYKTVISTEYIPDSILFKTAGKEEGEEDKWEIR